MDNQSALIEQLGTDKHHKNCKYKNYISFELFPCPYCRIEVLTEENGRRHYEAVNTMSLTSDMCAEIAENVSVPYEVYEQGLAGKFIAKAIKDRFSLRHEL